MERPSVCGHDCFLHNRDRPTLENGGHAQAKGAVMARVLVTGSSDGLGLMAARLLVEDGHDVTLHARNDARAANARGELPAAMDVVVGDLSGISGMRQVAEQANALGRYDALIHNAGIGYREPARIVTADGLSHVFAVNVLAPYVVTALMTRPDRLVYLSSGMHRGGDPDLSDLQWERRPWNGSQAYADSKLFDVVLAFAAARHWRTCSPTPLSRAGCRRRWAAPVLLMICSWPRSPRSGWRRATTLRPR